MSDQVHPEIMVEMRNSIANGSGKDIERAMTDEQVLHAVECEYPNGIDGYKQDIGAVPS